MWRRDAAPVIMLISTALLLDSNIRNSVCILLRQTCRAAGWWREILLIIMCFLQINALKSLI
jgi:hypothetical protein